MLDQPIKPPVRANLSHSQQPGGIRLWTGTFSSMSLLRSQHWMTPALRLESAFLMTFRELVWSGSLRACTHEAVPISQQHSKIAPEKVVDSIIYQQQNQSDIPRILPPAFQSNQIGRFILSSSNPLFIKESKQKKGKKKDSSCMFQSFLRFLTNALRIWRT